MRIIAASALVGVLMFAATAHGQTAPVPTPPAEPYRAIMVQAFAGEPTQWQAPPSDLIRRTKPEGDPAGWLHPADAPIAAWLKSSATANVTLVLGISPEGRVSGCTLEPRRAAQAPV